jgi:uncharacterized membrane protein YuzA (DUF378 family)
VFRRNKSTLKQVREIGDGAIGSSAGAARKVLRRPLGKVDSYAAAAMLLGMGNWLSMSLFNFDAVKAVAGRKSVSGRAAYGAVGLAALYGTVRGGRQASR